MCQVLIYVFDVESHERKKDLENFSNCLDAIKQNSKNAHVFALVHKMDLIQKEDERLKLYEERAAELKKMAEPLNITTFGTSIWDETLYKVRRTRPPLSHSRRTGSAIACADLLCHCPAGPLLRALLRPHRRGHRLCTR
jgi:hypothetical protein